MYKKVVYLSNSAYLFPRHAKHIETEINVHSARKIKHHCAIFPPYKSAGDINKKTDRKHLQKSTIVRDIEREKNNSYISNTDKSMLQPDKKGKKSTPPPKQNMSQNTMRSFIGKYFIKLRLEKYVCYLLTNRFN